MLHLDAHADLRDAYEGFTWSHASIMYNVVDAPPGVTKLVQVGIRDFSARPSTACIEQSGGRIVTFFDADPRRSARFDGEPWARAGGPRSSQALPEHVYLSFDIDGLDPTLCPHTGTPVPGGLSFHEAAALRRRRGARAAGASSGFDLNEVAPGPDGDEWDGNVGARLLYKMIGWALRSQRGGEGR